MDAMHYITHFKSTPRWHSMVQTVEASPWHREANVAVHTEMVIEQYLTHFAPHRSDDQNKIALLALLFHDTGKPVAEEVLEKKDGSGTYRRYAGHEQDSAISFTECWLSDPVLRSFVTLDEARKIRWIIEHHLPYGYKDGKKRSDLRTAIEHVLREDVETFYDCLRSDCWGRISDDHDVKKQNVEDWIREFRTVPLTISKRDSRMGTCYVLIGPSGSGKSTWVKAHKRTCDYVFSRDQHYLYFWRDHNGPSGKPFTDAKTEYADAWKFCCIDNEKEFERYLAEKMAWTFQSAKISHGSVFIDNTNGSKKARARYIQAARNIGMKVVAVEFWNTFDTLVERQRTRPEKHVPESSVRQQYYAQTCAWLGSEVDEVIVVPGV